MHACGIDAQGVQVFGELADLSKREGRTAAAKKYLRLAALAQPDSAAAWLKWAKIEEEGGNYGKAKRIVDRGLEANPLADALAIYGIKTAERIGDHRGVRRILGLVRQWDTGKGWKALSEVRRRHAPHRRRVQGACFEAKVGNVQLAREVFAHILKRCPGQGPIYIEAIRLEERCGSLQRAVAITQEFACLCLLHC